jgi:hypothetical protein
MSFQHLEKTMEIRLQNYRTDHGTKTVLVGEPGRKYMPVLIMDKGLIVKKVPLSDERYMSEVAESKVRRSLMPVVTFFAAYGARNGISKAAKRFIKDARS